MLADLLPLTSFNCSLYCLSLSELKYRALYNRRNFLHYLIPPPSLGAFYNNEKIIFFCY